MIVQAMMIIVRIVKRILVPLLGFLRYTAIPRVMFAITVRIAIIKLIELMISHLVDEIIRRMLHGWVVFT